MNKQITITLLLVVGLWLASCTRPGSAGAFFDYMNAGDEASAKGNYIEAEKQYKAALTQAEKDSDNAQIARALHYLGMNYSYQKKYTEAEDVFKRQVIAAEKAYGAQHSEVLYSLNDMTTFYLGQKRSDEAEGYNQKAVVICNKLPESERKQKCELTESLKDLIRQRKEELK